MFVEIKENIKLASDILISIGLLFIAGEILRLFIHDHKDLFWVWLLVNKTTSFSILFFYLAIAMMGEDNYKFIKTMTLVIASVIAITCLGFLSRWLVPDYALNNIPRAAISQFHLGILLLGILGRCGCFQKSK